MLIRRQPYFPPPGMIPSPGTPQNLILTDPLFNLREICKQVLLIEDHLIQPQKRCPDCITKHFLMAEAFADEMATLCTDPNMCFASQNLAAFIQDMHHSWHRGRDSVEVANRLRMVRKQLCARLYGYGQG